MWQARQARLRAAVVAVPPFLTLAVLLTGLDMYAIVHELGGRWGPAGMSQGAAADSLRWQWSYLLETTGHVVRLINFVG